MNVKKTIIKLVSVALAAMCTLTASCSKSNSYNYTITLETGAGIYPDINEKKEAIRVYSTYINDLSKFPVSFKYDGVQYNGLDKGCREISRNVTEGEQKVSHSIVLTAKNDLKITVESAIYTDYCAYEWTVYFEYTGTGKSPLLEDIKGADMYFYGENAILKGIDGDGGNGMGPYAPYTEALSSGKNVTKCPQTGRGTYNDFPYFNLEYGDGGVFIAIGWPVMWSANFKGEEDKVHFTGGQESISTYLEPGEKVRTPLMAFLNYSGRDEKRNMNLWRHWFSECNMRHIDGKLFDPQISGGTSWINNEMVNSTDKNQIKAIECYVENDIPITYWWMDAGWYFKTGDESLKTWLDTGNWSMDTKRFPSKMKAISDYANGNGIKTLLWFEPEIVRIDKSLLDENGMKREWIFDDGNGALVNMGIPEAVDWMVERVSSIIDAGGISLYRQDYGINPRGDFSGENRTDRIGITENLYVQGYLRYWDILIERYPSMMLDSCAAGGGRNDLESMRRAVPLHKTDHNYSAQDDKQAMHQTLFQWFPYFGAVVTGPDMCSVADTYSLRSSYCAWIAMCYNVFLRSFDWDTLKYHSDEWQKLKDFYYSDYYQILKWSNTDKDWRGWEFFDPDKDAGFIQLFRPEQSDENKKKIVLYGLDDDTKYCLEDTDGNLNVTLTGKELKETGFEMLLDQRRSSCVILISKV